MSRPVLTVEVGESLWDAWQLLFVSGLRHLVVLDGDGSSLGVLSDRSILAEVPATADHLSRRRVGDVLAMVPLVSVLPDDEPLTAARVMVTQHGRGRPGPRPRRTPAGDRHRVRHRPVAGPLIASPTS